ncbi:MAG: hypothetical protein IPF93_16615 [Saprospiraceae bacterium]|nr:hypothetical protein [Saprospiraceae bacterium]
MLSQIHFQKRGLNSLKKLSKYRKIDSGGRVLNNVGGPVADKLAFISEYKFVIAFENSSYPGYTTEKILDPFLVSSIPVYWGNPLIENDFNKMAFLNYLDFDSESDLIQKMLEIEKNPELAYDMLQQPVFPENQLPDCINEKNVIKFIKNIFDNKNNIFPVALSHLKHKHMLNRKLALVNNYYKQITKGKF